MKIIIQKPYPSEHSARLLSPDTPNIRVRRTHGSGDGTVQGVSIPLKIDIIWYITESGGEKIPRAQALRFPIENWTEKKARKWLEDNKIKYISFEPAKETKSEKIEKVNMRIEDVTKESIKDLSDSEIYKLRFRFCQIYDKYLSKSINVVVGNLNKEIILEKYDILVSEMKVRGKEVHTRNIDRALFKSKLHTKIEKRKNIVVLLKDMDNDERIVCGIIYEPDTVDTQGDMASEDEIKKAAYNFMENGGILKLQHQGCKIQATILENYLCPDDVSIVGRAIKKGTWIIVCRINDPDIWKQIKNGDLQGFSFAGMSEYHKPKSEYIKV